MQQLLTSLLLLTICASLFGQTSLDKNCLDKIVTHCNGIKFEKFDSPVIQKTDTFQYNVATIELQDANPISSLILQSGLLYPRLILSASTNGKNTFSSVDKNVIALITISGIDELEQTKPDPHIKNFRFLVWYQGVANPWEYLFQLKNDTPDQNSDPEKFIKTARLTAFGFCTIQI